MKRDRDFAPLPAAERDMRPTVGRAGRSGSPWLFGGVALLAAIFLFMFLDGRRRELTAPEVTVAQSDVVGASSALPPLVIPTVPPPPPVPVRADYEPVVNAIAAQAGSTPQAGPVSSGASPPPQTQYMPRPPSPPYQPQNYTPTQNVESRSLPDQPRGRSSSGALIIDVTAERVVTDARNSLPELPVPGAAPVATGRSGQLRRPAMTVPQGTLIPAVLETALDSSRPGFARAIVSSDVVGFDGSRVLIPRGSRLFGEYDTELGTGQNRATVQWTRLVRPDGVTIDLASPAADTVGRAGVEGRVNNRYLQRFASALLRTTLDIGANLAGRSLADGNVIVALPNASQAGVASSPDNAIRSTLRVEAGTRVGVLVARDLEFTSGARRR